MVQKLVKPLFDPETDPMMRFLRSKLRENVGRINDFCEVKLPKGQRPPVGQAYCYKCNKETRWRGPVPRLHEAPTAIRRKNGIDYQYAIIKAEGEDRLDAQRRLYAIVDKHKDGPMQLSVDDLVLWQGALCAFPCEVEHQSNWMDYHYPPAGVKGNRQGGTAID